MIEQAADKERGEQVSTLSLWRFLVVADYTVSLKVL